MLTKHAPPIYKFAKLVMKPYYNKTYKITVKGAENIPFDGPVIIASSHVTNRDPIFLGVTCDRHVNFMAKDSLFKNKLIGWFLKHIGAFPVVRGSGGEDALKHAYELLDRERLICVFIEGTRSKDGTLGKPKTGVAVLAQNSGATVVPVSIIAENGQLPLKYKRKMMINIGKPLSVEDLDLKEGTGLHHRRASKLIMGKISDLREEAIELMAETSENKG